MATLPTVDDMVGAVEAVLGPAFTGVRHTQRDEEITENINPVPMIQIYCVGMNSDVMSSGGHTTTFQTGVISREITIRVDLYARQRAHIGQDMEAQRVYTDAIMAELDKQWYMPAFDIDGIQDFRWSANMVSFSYGPEDVKYIGTRIDVVLRGYYARDH